MERLNVSIDNSLVEELRRIVPKRQRSRFICEAVEEKLHRLKQEQAVRAAAGIWSSEGRALPDEQVRDLRGSWKHRMERSEEERG